MDYQTDKSVAEILLKIKAISLSPEKPFTWASGIKSPIYCDNRLLMSFPQYRRTIAEGLSQLIKQHYPQAEVIAGTATAGIPHAAWISDILDLPMVYVRSSAKDHGRKNQIEGFVAPKQKVVIVEDLISTGKSVFTAAAALRESGAEVLGVVAIFSYLLPQAATNFENNQLTYYPLSNYHSLLNVALEKEIINQDENKILAQWNQSPETWNV